MPYGRGPFWVPRTIPAGGWRAPWTPRRVLHAPAPVETFTRRVRAVLDQSAAVVLNAGGAGFVQLAPDGLVVWYVHQWHVATTSGPTDHSAAFGYRSAVVPHRQLFETSQGGGDGGTFDCELRPGDTLAVIWSGGNPGDTATLNISGHLVAMLP